MDKVIPLRERLKSPTRSYAIRGLSLEERESLQQLLTLLRTPTKKETIKFTVWAHFETLPGEKDYTGPEKGGT